MRVGLVGLVSVLLSWLPSQKWRCFPNVRTTRLSPLPAFRPTSPFLIAMSASLIRMVYYFHILMAVLGNFQICTEEWL